MTLEHFLRWDADATDSEYATEFERRAEERLSTALGIIRSQSSALAEQLISLVQVLPPHLVLRIAQAPELEFQLRLCRTGAVKPETLAMFLGKLFEAELVAAPDESAHPSEAMEVDFDGPFNRGDVARRFPVYGTLKLEDRANLPERLEAAMRLLDRGAPLAGQFTRNFTKVVVPLSVPNLESRYGSFSSSWYPGRTVLVNPDLAGSFDLTAALLHEAIHSLVDVSEIGGCLIADGESGASQVDSPWTGAHISLQSLMDAYFVWYGLLWFWILAKQSGAVSTSNADRLIELCGRGFLPDFEDVVGERLRAVHEKTRLAIESLRCAVLEEVPVTAKPLG